MAGNTHEAIVSKELYEQAQKVLRRNVRKKEPAKPAQRFRGLLKCSVCKKALVRTVCKDPYFTCGTGKVLPDSPCRRIHLKERDLEAAVLASIQSQARLRLETGTEDKREDVLGGMEREIQDCRNAMGRYKAGQTAAFEDYAEGRITRQEYISRKEEAARRHEETTALYMELSAKRAKLLQEAENPDRTDWGRYACVCRLTRELLEELVKEIRVSGKDDLEIVWNFRE